VVRSEKKPWQVVGELAWRLEVVRGDGRGWNSNTLATSCEELTHWKRRWCWEGLGAGGEGDDRGWDGWMASPTRCTWVWVNSGSWWWTGRPGMLRFMGLQRVGYDWVIELNWTDGTDKVYFAGWKKKRLEWGGSRVTLKKLWNIL